MSLNIIDPRKELPEHISELADKICLQINEIETLEERLKTLKFEKEESIKQMAEILDTAGYAVGSKIFLKNGRQMNLKAYLQASLPSQSAIDACKDENKRQELEDKKTQGLKWLDENGMGDIIKNNIIAVLPRGSNEIAKEIASYLSEKQVSFVKDESVHYQTLLATIKGALKDGMNVPFDVFSINSGTTVEIK